MQGKIQHYPNSWKNKQTIKTAFKEAQILDLADKDYKASIINIFREVKELKKKCDGNVSSNRV